MQDRLLPLAIACAVAVLSALGLVLTRRLVHCAGLLLVHSLAIAALYFVLSADFVAVGQVMVYSGAIVVLFLFVVLLLPQGGVEEPLGTRRLLLALTGGALMLAALLFAMVELLHVDAPTAPPPGDSSVAAVARSLFGPQLVPFELTALLLLVAIIGGVSMWQRQGGDRMRGDRMQ
jgi:NADH-quinone oxidoreductase subunit J